MDDLLFEVGSHFLRHIDQESVVIAQFVVSHASRDPLLGSLTDIAELLLLLLSLTYVSLQILSFFNFRNSWFFFVQFLPQFFHPITIDTVCWSTCHDEPIIRWILWPLLLSLILDYHLGGRMFLQIWRQSIAHIVYHYYEAYSICSNNPRSVQCLINYSNAYPERRKCLRTSHPGHSLCFSCRTLLNPTKSHADEV